MRRQLQVFLFIALMPFGISQSLADAEQASRAATALREGNFDGVKEACQAGADAGDPPCLEAMAQLLINAKNPERDPRKGIALLRRAAEAGLVSAQSALGVEHYMGINAEPNAELAIAWMQKAADAGRPQAQNNLANLYRDGRLVSRDLAKARALYTAAGNFEPARIALAEMTFYGEGGPRDGPRAYEMLTELAKSSNEANAKRAQAVLDQAKKYAEPERFDVAVYLNPYSSDVRRNLEGRLITRDAGGQAVSACWPDNFYRQIQPGAVAALPSFEQRLNQRLPKAVADGGVRNGGLRIVKDGNCIRTAPLLIATRGLNAGLGATITLTLNGDNRETQQVARVDFMALVLEANLEGRDRSAVTFNEGFAEKISKWALTQAAESGKPIYAGLALTGPTGALTACTLKSDAAAARTLFGQTDAWSRRKLQVGTSAPRELDSPEALFDALSSKPASCQVVIGAAAAIDRISTALTRDKIAHRLVAEAGWTPEGVTEMVARGRGFASASQMAFADTLGASPADLERLAGAGISSPDIVKEVQRRAAAIKYPAEPVTVEALLQFLDDEASGRKSKKTATVVARERMAAEAAAKRAEEAARAKQAAADEAARKKAEAEALAQKKRDELDRNAERLSGIAGTMGTIACHNAAESYVSSVEKYAHKWDDVGTFGTLFDKYLVHVETPGVLTMVSNHLSMQNGFGAYKKVKVLCNYDTRAKKVVNVLLDD